jgi:hypothetical protein
MHTLGNDQPAVPGKGRTLRKRLSILFATSLLADIVLGPGTVHAQQQQPSPLNIVVLGGDDVGFWNLCAYSRGAKATGHGISIASRRTARLP